MNGHQLRLFGLGAVCVQAVLIMLSFTSALAEEVQEGGEHGPIIDVHIHVYDQDPRWVAAVPNPASGRPMTATDEESHMRETVAAMDEHGVVKAVISNYHNVVQRWCKAAPDRFIPSFGVSDPTAVSVEFIRDEHAAGRLKALGEIASQYEGLAPNDPALEPLYALAEELKSRLECTLVSRSQAGFTMRTPTIAPARAIRCYSRMCWCGTLSFGYM